MTRRRRGAGTSSLARETTHSPTCGETCLHNSRPFDNRRCKTPSDGDKLASVMPDSTTQGMLDLSKRDLDGLRPADGMGAGAAHAAMSKECADLMRQSFKRRTPFPSTS